MGIILTEDDESCEERGCSPVNPAEWWRCFECGLPVCGDHVHLDDGLPFCIVDWAFCKPLLEE